MVIRFTPISAEKLAENAEDTYFDDVDEKRHPPRYGISVLAGWCEGNESFDQAVERILEGTHLNGRTITVTTGNKLRQIGLEVIEDPNEKEPRHHLVGENPFTEPPRVDLLASLLDNCRRRNPAWRKGAAA